MSWHPEHLTPAQLEARRLAAGRLLRAGRLSQAEIARAFGVSRAAVSHWRRQLERAGLAGLRRRPHPGRPPRLSAAQWQRLGTQLRQGSQAQGFATEQWTLRRIAQLIQRCYGVRYHPRYLERPLKQHGFTAQRPATQAKERDDALVRAWVKHDWELVKKRLDASTGRLPSWMRRVTRFGPA
jgi:transposase